MLIRIETIEMRLKPINHGDFHPKPHNGDGHSAGPSAWGGKLFAEKNWFFKALSYDQYLFGINVNPGFMQTLINCGGISDSHGYWNGTPPIKQPFGVY